MMACDVRGEHEAAAIEAIDQPKVVIHLHSGEEVAGEVAAVNLEAKPLTQKPVEAGEADGVAQPCIEHPEQVAVVGGVVVFAVAAEPHGTFPDDEEPLTQFTRIHAALVAKGFLCQCVQPLSEVSWLSAPAVEEGGDLGHALLELGGGRFDPAPAHPSLFEFRAPRWFQEFAEAMFFFSGQRTAKMAEALRKLATDADELALDSFLNNARLIIEERDQVV